MTALQSSETWPAVPVAVNPDGAERVVVVAVVVSSSFSEVTMAQEIIVKVKKEIIIFNKIDKMHVSISFGAFIIVT